MITSLAYHSTKIKEREKVKRLCNDWICLYCLYFYIFYIVYIYIVICLYSRTSKLPTPKKCTTPKHQKTDVFGIPRFLTPPRHSSSFNMNNPQSPQRLNRSLINFQRYSPTSDKKNIRKIQQSPLKEANRITAKVKPLNLVNL